jgi:cell division GTPase FtsZ
MTQISSERANEMLADRVRLKISIIGIGNAGNQLLNEAIKRENVRVFAVNSSQKDLGNAVTNAEIPSFIIGHDAKGAGKSRESAAAFFQQNGAELATAVPSFSNMCDSSDVIIVAGSTAGGTGSGVAPQMVRLLQMMYNNKIIIYVGILPRITDAPKAQQNSIECLNEIQECKVPYLLADLDYYKGVPNHIAYQKIQQYLMDCIDIMGGRFLNHSQYGMIDENDMRVILSEPGYLSMYNLAGITQSQLEKETMQAQMVKLIKSSPAAERTRNGIISQMGVVLNTPEEMTDVTMSSDYTELTDYIGTPISIFENFATVSGATGQMIIILSGQSSPIARINEMNERAQQATGLAQTDYDFKNMIEGFNTKDHKTNIDLTGETQEKNEDAKRAAALSFFKKN